MHNEGVVEDGAGETQVSRTIQREVAMHHAIIIAWDSGESLRPLTSELTPTALLALGDQRTFMLRIAERLASCFPPERLWVVSDSRSAPEAQQQLGGLAHLIESPSIPELPNALSSALSQIREAATDPPAVLLQPAHHVIDGDAFCSSVGSGLDLALAQNRPVSFTVASGSVDRSHTGIEAWPLDLLSRQIALLEGHVSRWPLLQETGGTRALDVALSNEIGWIDVSTWQGVRELLRFVKKPWGHERLWALNEHYAGKVLFIKAGESLSLQFHQTKDETIHIISGQMRFRVGPSAEELGVEVLDPGDSYAISPGTVHQMEAIDDCTLVEVSTPHLQDVVRLQDRYGRA